MNVWKYLGNIFMTPLLDDQKFYEPHPGAKNMLQKNVTLTREAWNIYISAISLKTNFSKFVL